MKGKDLMDNLLNVRIRSAHEIREWRVILKSRRDEYPVTGVRVCHEKLVVQSNMYYRDLNLLDLISRLRQILRVTSANNRKVIVVRHYDIYDICGFFFDNNRKRLTILIH